MHHRIINQLGKHMCISLQHNVLVSLSSLHQIMACHIKYQQIM